MSFIPNCDLDAIGGRVENFRLEISRGILRLFAIHLRKGWGSTRITVGENFC